MRIILKGITLILLFLPNLAVGSYGSPLPSVDADTLVSHLILNLAIGMYVLCFALTFAFILSGKKIVGILNRYTTIIAVLLHAGGYLLRWKESYDYGWGHFPLSSFYESLIIYCLMLAVMCLYLQIKSLEESIGVFFLPFVVLILFVAEKTQFAGISALYDPKYSYNIELIEFAYRLQVLKLLLLTVGYCFLTTAAAVSLMLVASKAVARNALPVIPPKLPPEQTLYEWNRKTILGGVALLFLGFIFGLFWAKYFWGVYWSWAPQEFLLALVLVIYTVFAVRNQQNGWCTSRASNKSIIGLVTIVFFYFIVQSLFRGI